MNDTMDDFWLIDFTCYSKFQVLIQMSVYNSRSFKSLKHLTYFPLYRILLLCILLSSVTSFTVYCLPLSMSILFFLLPIAIYLQAQAPNPNLYVQVLQGLSILNEV